VQGLIFRLLTDISTACKPRRLKMAF